MSENELLLPHDEIATSSHESTVPNYLPSLKAFRMHDIQLEPSIPSDSLITPTINTFPKNVIPRVTPVSTDQFMQVVEDVREAITLGIHPILISKGSSGSYFCRNKFEEIVGVFKPKDEEPYGNMNPKCMKWIHRNLFPCCFGRDALIPNLGYISEAAASFIDSRLRLGIVPRTEIVCLASPVFSYTKSQLGAHIRKHKPLPLKIGSFQLFVKGYMDASSAFFKGYDKLNAQESSNEDSFWTADEQQGFRLSFEKMVILDYLIRQTDRSMDNWLIKDITNEDNRREISYVLLAHYNSHNNPSKARVIIAFCYYSSRYAHCLIDRLAAIDNGLAFPFKHPDSIRSYPYGWTLLPISNIPFSKEAKSIILPFLTSQMWWQETYLGLHLLFSLDDDFTESLFTKQLSVIRGQSLNLIEILNRCESPSKLVQRTLVTVVEETETGLGLFTKRGKESLEKVKRRIKEWKSTPLFTSC